LFFLATKNSKKKIVLWVIVVFTGMLNEYGLVKDMLQKQHEGGAGLDEKADFDDYTIYDEGQRLLLVT